MPQLHLLFRIQCFIWKLRAGPSAKFRVTQQNIISKTLSATKQHWDDNCAKFVAGPIVRFQFLPTVWISMIFFGEKCGRNYFLLFSRIFVNYTVFDVNWKMHKLKTQRWYLSFALRTVWNFPIHQSALGNHWSQPSIQESKIHCFDGPCFCFVRVPLSLGKIPRLSVKWNCLNPYGSRFLATHAQRPRRIALSVFHMEGIRLIEPKYNMCSKFKQQSERTWVTVSRRVTLTL